MFPEENDNCQYLVDGKFSSPSCKEFGISYDEKQPNDVHNIWHTPLHIDETTCMSKTKTDPFSPRCIIPLPAPFGSSLYDPTCIRRRNERERDRVRCVNDGYVRLKEHLPIENKDKRISKVETLRSAIRYIKYLQRLLEVECSDNGGRTDSNINFSGNSGSHDAGDSSYSENVSDTESESDGLYYSMDSADISSDSEYK